MSSTAAASKHNAALERETDGTDAVTATAASRVAAASPSQGLETDLCSAMSASGASGDEKGGGSAPVCTGLRSVSLVG
jgi:hypothetical protein